MSERCKTGNSADRRHRGPRSNGFYGISKTSNRRKQMNDQNQKHPNAAAIETLERTLWRMVEELGPCSSSSVDRMSIDELCGYAFGAGDALIFGLERLQNKIQDEDDPALRPDAMLWRAQL